jgi:hypothetical protein
MMLLLPKVLGGLGVPALLLLVAGCASTTPPAATIRSSALTAPADLQLLCASEAATRFSVPADGVLPIASRSGSSEGTFEVDVRLPAGQALCIIDDSGTIVSLESA